MLNKKRKIILFILGGILIVTGISFGVVKIADQFQMGKEKKILAEVDESLTAINDHISVDKKNSTIFTVYADGKKNEYFSGDLDEYGEVEKNTLYGVTADGENVVIDCSDVDDFDLFDMGESELYHNILIYQNDGNLVGKNVMTGKTNTLMKLSDADYVDGFAYSDKYTLLSTSECGDSDDLDDMGEEVLYLYNNKTKTKEEIYRDSYGSGRDLLGGMFLYGEKAYYYEYTCDDLEESSTETYDQSIPLYEYDIQSGETTQLFNDGFSSDRYENRLLLYLDGKGGVFNMDTGKLEARFSLPSYWDEIPFLTLYKDKIIYYNEPTAALMEYDYKRNRSTTLYQFPVEIDHSGHIKGTGLCNLSSDRITVLGDKLRIDLSLHGEKITYDFPGHQGERMSRSYYIKQYHFLFDMESKKMKYIKQTGSNS